MIIALQDCEENYLSWLISSFSPLIVLSCGKHLGHVSFCMGNVDKVMFEMGDWLHKGLNFAHKHF